MADSAASKIDKTAIVIFALLIVASIGVAFLLISITDRSEKSVENIKSVKVKEPTTDMFALPTNEETNLALADQVDGDLTVYQKIITEYDFTEEAFKKLTRYRSLKKLCLYQCTFDNAWLESLLILPLKQLEFDGTDLNLQGLLITRKLPNLINLSLRGTALTDSDLAQLPPHLIHLRLGNTFTDKGMKYVVNLRDLKTLELKNLPITDETIKTLKRCKTLTALKISFCPLVTPKSVSEFRESMPGCSVSLTP